MGDESDFAFLHKAGYFRWHGSTHQRLHHDDVSFSRDDLDYFSFKIRYSLRKAAPDLLKAATDRHNAVLAIRNVSALCAVGAKSQHGVHIVSGIGSKKVLGDLF